MEFFKNTNFDFLGKKWPFIILSLVLTAAGLISLAVKGGPRYGIDFRGGALITVTFANRPPVDKVRAALSGKLPGVEVQEVSGKPEDIIGIDAREDAALQTFAPDHRRQPGRRLRRARQRQVQHQLRRRAERWPIICAIPGGRGRRRCRIQQLQTLVSGIMDYRKQHNGLIQESR